MDVIKLIVTIITSVIFVYLGVYSLYLFVFSVAGKLITVKKPPESDSLARFVIYICSYKEDEIILNSAASAITLDYPKELFHICVIADSLKPETIQKLKQMRLQVVEVVLYAFQIAAMAFVKITAVKALVSKAGNAVVAGIAIAEAVGHNEVNKIGTVYAFDARFSILAAAWLQFIKNMVPFRLYGSAKTDLIFAGLGIGRNFYINNQVMPVAKLVDFFDFYCRISRLHR